MTKSERTRLENWTLEVLKRQNSVIFLLVWVYDGEENAGGDADVKKKVYLFSFGDGRKEKYDSASESGVNIGIRGERERDASGPTVTTMLVFCLFVLFKIKHK